MNSKSLLSKIDKRTIESCINKNKELLKSHNAFISRVHREVILRSLINFVLSTEYFVNLEKLWNSIGDKRKAIKKGIKKSSIKDDRDLLTNLIYYIVRERTSISSSGSEKKAEELAFSEYSSLNGTNDLRCEICGYHFRRADCGSRLSNIQNCNLRLASLVHPLREEDEFKPLYARDDKSSTLTELEVDHVIPKSLILNKTHSNIQFLCKFCNLAKGASLFPFENISFLLQESSTNLAIRHKVIFYLTMSENNFTCSNTGRDIRECELTIIRDKSKSHPFILPNHYRAVSYESLVR
jgi:hypothetical protein